MPLRNNVVCLMGPTASGKTALACKLVNQFPFEIVSVDSALIYQQMNIGTAKPDNETLKSAPHHLIDILTPNQSYSAGDFCLSVTSICHAILSKGKIPLLVGGTMMYFNALQQGLGSLPSADSNIRHRILQDANQHGWEYVHQQLRDIDPLSANRIHVSDKQRTQRALEVYLITGEPLSALSQRNIPQDFTFTNIRLIPDNRSWLHQRIQLRLEQMLEQGFIQEVIELRNNWNIDANFPAMRTVGYRQALAFLNGEYDFSTFYQKALATTRQLAKRQITWLKHWETGLVVLPECEDIYNQLVVILRQMLDNNGNQ
jgi:tRNA dimethylallyltransferase